MTEKAKSYNDMTNAELFKLMAGPSQIKRKNAAKTLKIRVKENPEEFSGNIKDFIDALGRPEAQTRWECLDCLTMLVALDTNSCKDAIEYAEEALFDEKTSLIRESAVRFLSRYGATSKARSKEVWPLIKEALEQFHGEIEYDAILNRVVFFGAGKLDDAVKKDLRKVCREIIKSVAGPTAARLDRILAATSGKSIKGVNSAAAKKATKKAKSEKSKTSSAPKKTSKKSSTKKVEKKPKAKAASAKTTKKASATKKTTNKKAATTKKASAKKASTKASSTKKPAKKKAASKTTANKTKTKKE